MAHQNVLVIGGSGFIGSRVIAQLARGTDYRVTVPTRRYERAKHLLVMPTVALTEVNVHDDAVLDALIGNADVVINLVGILHGRRGAKGSAYGADFEAAHVSLPRRIVASCARQGVGRYLHMSALGASTQAPSMYLRSKADGETAAFSSPAVAATVFRPSVVFGEGDNFLNMFAALQRRLPLMPLAGADCRFQPVYVGDVAQAIVQTLSQDRYCGKRYDLVGPTVYSLRELVHLAGIYAGHPRTILSLPPALAYLQAWALEYLPGHMMSRDNLASLQLDSVAADAPAAELGLTPTALESIAPRYLAGVDTQQQLDAFRRNAKR